ncbi:MAG: CAP domain-containing protein [Akkermansiaceae bacterium]|nr:CAP domain-containing protein [Akkermansiaceae bacterium]
MKSYPITKVILLASIAALASCSAPSKLQTIIIPTSSGKNSQLSDQIFNGVNAYRQSKGMSDLQRHAGLDQLAKNHSEYMLQNRGKFKVHGKNVSHWGHEGRALIAQQRFGFQNTSENVAAAYNPGKSAASVLLQLWATSKAHRINLDSSWPYTGIGTAVDRDGTVFATQIFATARTGQQARRERFNQH